MPRVRTSARLLIDGEADSAEEATERVRTVMEPLVREAFGDSPGYRLEVRTWAPDQVPPELHPAQTRAKRPPTAAANWAARRRRRPAP